MSWQQAPDPSQRSSQESRADREARLAWQQGGTSLLPSAARLADRIITVILLAFGAVLTILIGIVAIVSVIAGSASCHAADGCSPGGMIGGAALAAGGAFVLGVATVVVAVAAWLRRRSSWWIAAIGFVLATGCVVWGGVIFTDAADHATGLSTQDVPSALR